MAHDNDSFIREVNDELRSEQLTRVWRRYRPFIIGAAVLVVVGTAGYRGYEYWHSHNASQYGDQFLGALNLAKEGKTDEAMAALQKLESDGSGAYPVLAQMRAATLMAEKGDAAGAIKAFKEVSGDSAVPGVIRDIAKVRAGYLLVDSGSYADVSAEVEAMATGNGALRNSAREVLGLAAYKAGDMTKAREWYEEIVNDAQAPRNLANRAQIMLDTMTSSAPAAAKS